MLKPGEVSTARRVPLCKPEVGDAEIEAIRRVFDAGSLSHGPQVAEFEKAFAAYVGTRHAISLNSWTSASFLVCSYLRERHGAGEIILPSYTFVASANTIVNAGLTPRFADVDWATHEVTAATLAPLINDATRGIMVVHFGGLPCRMPEIMALASERGVPVIEDSAECLGAEVGGRQAGSFAIGIFSFYGTKNITTGEGGMVTTNDDELADWVRLRVGHGVRKGSFSRDGRSQRWYRNAVAPGHNFRLSNVQAAMGLVQLNKLTAMNARRHAVARAYDAALAALRDVERPALLPEGQHSYQMYVIHVPAAKRDRVLTALIDAGVEASVHFDPPVHEQTAYASPSHPPLPVTERLARASITLPISSVQTIDDTAYVADALRQALSA
jgi:perosamine synthetase